MFLIPALLLFGIIWKFVNIETGICFIFGIIFWILVKFASIKIMAKTSLVSAKIVDNSLNSSLKKAFAGSSAMGSILAGLGLLGLSALFITFKDPATISGFALGVCFTLLFSGMKNRYRKPGEENEEDTSNCIGLMGISAADADIFTSYICSILAAITLGAADLAFKGAILPIVISGFAIFASIIAMSFVKLKEKSNQIMCLRFASFITIVLTLIASYFIIKLWMPMFFGIFWAILIGAVAGCLIRMSNGYHTCTKFKPVKGIVQALETEGVNDVISSLKVGLASVIFPFIIICSAALWAFWSVGGFENFGFGIYGVAMASLGMLCVTGIIGAGDAYASIYTNVNKIGKISEIEKEVKEYTDKQVNAISADSKGFAVASSVLSTLALLYAFISTTGVKTIDLLDPKLVSGLLFGSCLPFLFLSLSINNPKHKLYKTFKISLAVVLPVLTGIFVGAEALSTMLLGAVASGFCLILATANAMSAWKSAKRSLENFELEDKNCIFWVSANNLIKIMVIVSLVFAALFMRAGQ
jgi:K(+)-stimulated pyrophosphate-energized sodium pump